MKVSLIFTGLLLPLLAGGQSPAPLEKEISWQDISTWGVEGRGWIEGLESFYDRLPLRIKEKVGDGIWGFSRNSSGICVRFYADTSEIHVRYRLNSGKISAFADVSATSSSGVDLYVQTTSAEGEKPVWRFAASNKPKTRDVNEILAKGLAPGRHLYQLYLPVYNGVEKFEIGVPSSAKLEAVPPRTEAPLVFYGTSITQGGVASRPGLAFPAILGRRLDLPFINLGFCGYGKMEPELLDLLAELKPLLFVIDALQNMQPTAVTERAETMIRRLQEAHPGMPILLVEFGDHPSPGLFPAEADKRVKLNAALRAAYEKLKGEGFKNLYYLPGSALLGSDGEATGDALHPNALGMIRYADAYEPVLREILNSK